jgi:hypothetical protein
MVLDDVRMLGPFSQLPGTAVFVYAWISHLGSSKGRFPTAIAYIVSNGVPHNRPSDPYVIPL